MEGYRISSVSRVNGYKEDTILDWLRDTAEQGEALKEVLMADYQINRGQLDEFVVVCTKQGKKGHPETYETGQFWRSTMIESDARLRVVRGIAETESEAAQQVFQTLQRRGHPEGPPPTVSDGWGGNRKAMVAVYGKVPEYQGISRPPTIKQPQEDWQYL